jgi:hypothetical protein
VVLAVFDSMIGGSDTSSGSWVLSAFRRCNLGDIRLGLNPKLQNAMYVTFIPPTLTDDGANASAGHVGITLGAKSDAFTWEAE